MLAFAYDAALRREELCGLCTADIDPSLRMLRIRAENTKGRRDRIVPYSTPSSALLQQYLNHRRGLGQKRGSLFLSESRRNYAEAISIWPWSKIVLQISKRAKVTRFTTHTLRHLCLTDLPVPVGTFTKSPRSRGTAACKPPCCTSTLAAVIYHGSSRRVWPRSMPAESRC